MANHFPPDAGRGTQPHRPRADLVPEVTPAVAQAFQALREAADADGVAVASGVTAKVVRELARCGAVELVRDRAPAAGAPARFRLLVARVQGNPDLEPAVRRAAPSPPGAAQPLAAARAAERSAPGAGAEPDALPTLEEMRSLLAAIARAEREASADLADATLAERDAAWAALARLAPGALGFRAALGAFEAARVRHARASGEARARAFAAVRADGSLGDAARHLRLLSARTDARA